MARRKKIEILRDNQLKTRSEYVEFADTIEGEATEEQADKLEKLQEAITAANKAYQEYYAKINKTLI